MSRTFSRLVRHAAVAGSLLLLGAAPASSAYANGHVEGTIVAEKLRELISAIVVPEVEERITASFGLATFPEHGSDDSEVLGAADQALYAAKALGRDRVVAAGAPAAELEPVAS